MVTCVLSFARTQAQRWLQQSLEQHGRYITSLIERQNGRGGAEPLPPPPSLMFPPPLQPLADEPPGASTRRDSRPASGCEPSSMGQLSHLTLPGASAPATAPLPASAPLTSEGGANGIDASNAAPSEPSDADLLEPPGGVDQQDKPGDGPLSWEPGDLVCVKAAQADDTQRGRKRRQAAGE